MPSRAIWAGPSLSLHPTDQNFGRGHAWFQGGCKGGLSRNIIQPPTNALTSAPILSSSSVTSRRKQGRRSESPMTKVLCAVKTLGRWSPRLRSTKVQMPHRHKVSSKKSTALCLQHEGHHRSEKGPGKVPKVGWKHEWAEAGGCSEGEKGRSYSRGQEGSQEGWGLHRGCPCTWAQRDRGLPAPQTAWNGLERPPTHGWCQNLTGCS